MTDTIKLSIRNRWTNELIYATEIPGDTPSGMQMRVALEGAGPVAAHRARCEASKQIHGV